MENAKNDIREKFIKRCIELADESSSAGDLPFGSLVACGSKIIAESINTAIAENDITGHAEINAIKKALALNPDIDFSKCSLYSNFEPCAMCAFIARDVGIGEVVFAVPSPHIGGYSRWDILNNKNLLPSFTARNYSVPPKIASGVLENSARQIFDRLGFKIHKK